MIYRRLQVIATNQWISGLFTSNYVSKAGVASFSVPPESHQASIAAALGVSPETLRVVDADTDPGSGTKLSLPTRPTVLSRQEELLAIGKDNWTDAQQKELIELLANA